jgi:hypothetical protein
MFNILMLSILPYFIILDLDMQENFRCFTDYSGPSINLCGKNREIGKPWAIISN